MTLKSLFFGVATLLSCSAYAQVFSGVAMDPAQGLYFPPTMVGDQTSELTVTLKNTYLLNDWVITQAVVNDSQYVITNDTCSGATVLRNGGACTITVKFVPKEAGGTPGSRITLTRTSGGGDFWVPLNGAGRMTPYMYHHWQMGLVGSAAVTKPITTGAGTVDTLSANNITGSVASDATGNVYVAAGLTITKYDPAGQVIATRTGTSAQWNMYSTCQSGFYTPGIANIFHTGNGELQVLFNCAAYASPNSSFVRVSEDTLAPLGQPMGLSSLNPGHSVGMDNVAGNYAVTCFNQPSSGFGHGALYRFNLTTGSYQRLWYNMYDYCRASTVMLDGTILFVTTSGLYRYDDTGGVKQLTTNGASSISRLTTGGDGNVYATVGASVYKVSKFTGFMSLYAGSPNNPGNVDGDLIQARFPTSPYIKPDWSSVLMFKSDNATVRRIH